MAFEITGVSTTADAAAQAITETGDTALGQDTFLRLLTTQLQNQDPTDPVSNEQFIAQLAQFSQLEQLQSLNEQVEMLYYVNSSMNNAAMTNLLGQTVVAVSDAFHYDGAGDQSIWYDADSSATSATLDIYDEDGSLVWSGSMGALSAGEGSYTWDGRGLDGLPVPEGDYTFQITAYDANGNEVEVEGRIRGVVDEMSFDSGAATPTVDGLVISMGDILRLYTESAE